MHFCTLTQRAVFPVHYNGSPQRQQISSTRLPFASLVQPVKYRFSHLRLTHNGLLNLCARSSAEILLDHCNDQNGAIDQGEHHDDLVELSVKNETVEVGDRRRDDLADRSLVQQMKEIVMFSGPATGLWICAPLMSLIDTAVIGQGSSIELAALGKSNAYVYVHTNTHQ